jgi:4-oxalocrotonate tautomerase
VAYRAKREFEEQAHPGSPVTADRRLSCSGWEGAGMPIIRVEMWEGRSLEQKQRLVRELTDVLTRIVDCDPATVRVLIDDYSRENWAVGGILQSERERASPPSPP